MKKNDVLKNFVLYPVYLLVFCALNKVYADVPFSCAIYASILPATGNVVGTTICFIASFLVYRDFSTLFLATVFAFVYVVIYLIYLKRKRKIGVESMLFVFLGLLAYVFYFKGGFSIEKLVYTSIIAVFSVCTTCAVSALKYKKLSRNTNVYEAVSCALTYVFISIGLINLFGMQTYKPLSLLLFVLVSRYYKNELSGYLSMIAALPLVVVTKSHVFLTVYAIFALTFTAVKSNPPIIISSALIACELILGVVFRFYGEYLYVDAIPTITAFIICGIIPTSVFDTLSQKYNFSAEDTLIRSVINKNRADTASRLYEISNVFYKMQDAFLNLKKCSENVDEIIDKMVDEVIFNTCSNCQLKNRCINKNAPKRDLVEKIVRIGVSKGKVSIVDLPRDFTNVCLFPNSAIFEVNRLIGAYYDYLRSAEGSDKSKEILSLQSAGVAEVLKNLAFTLSKTSTENEKEEKRILKVLSKHGFKCEAALCYGEGNDTEIALFAKSESLDKHDAAKILSKAYQTKFSLVRNEAVFQNANALSLKFSPKFDAAFGVSRITKNGSELSGDCHSLIKIDERRFLVALSDGMGSGKTARLTSETALDLIESLYRAGLKSEYVLKLVNKLLAFSIDDNFSAIDVALVDLSEGVTSFIKIGSPYGFILSNTGIKYIEGSSLPIGILDELRPTTATTTLDDGDVIVMLSDGITDAFGSSSELIDFLKSAPILNPQELSDVLAEKALELSHGVAEDDMTAVCVRLFNAT